MRFSPGAMVWTLFGWTPGLRQIVAGRVLDCGCLAGLYETCVVRRRLSTGRGSRDFWSSEMAVSQTPLHQ